VKVFISHLFADEELATTLQKILQEKNIDAYMAQRVKEYELKIDQKVIQEITESDYVVAIITTNTRASASVNQELGYAQGKNVPRIAMIESNAKVGILLHGMDSEDFTRENFTKRCERVRTYLLDKDLRKNNLEKNSELVEVYKLLYNALSKLNDKALLKDQLEDPWNVVDSYSKLKTDSMISEEFEKLSEEIKVWNDMSRAKLREIQYKQKAIGDILAACFQKYDLLNSHGDIILSEHSSITPSNWVRALHDVLLYDPTITSGKNLYDNLYAYTILRDDEHHIFLKGFKQRAPLLFECIFLHLTEARSILSGEITDNQIFNQNNILKTHVQKIKEKLEEILQ